MLPGRNTQGPELRGQLMGLSSRGLCFSTFLPLDAVEVHEVFLQYDNTCSCFSYEKDK